MIGFDEEASVGDRLGQGRILIAAGVIGVVLTEDVDDCGRVSFISAAGLIILSLIVSDTSVPESGVVSEFSMAEEIWSCGVVVRIDVEVVGPSV